MRKEFLKNQDAQPAKYNRLTPSQMAYSLHWRCRLPGGELMTLRIERLEGRVRLSGEFRIACVDQVKAEIEKCKSRGALDLEEVALIDLEGVRFLNACEANGIAVLHCSPYIREWMLQERIRGRKS